MSVNKKKQHNLLDKEDNNIIINEFQNLTINDKNINARLLNERINEFQNLTINFDNKFNDDDSDNNFPMATPVGSPAAITNVLPVRKKNIFPSTITPPSQTLPHSAETSISTAKINPIMDAEEIIENKSLFPITSPINEIDTFKNNT